MGGKGGEIGWQAALLLRVRPGALGLRDEVGQEQRSSDSVEGVPVVF